MKFLVDESVEFPVVTYLRSQGHDVVAVAEDFPSTADADILASAWQQERILVTNDRDFGELVFFHELPHRGIIFFRLPRQDVLSKIERLDTLFTKFKKRLFDHFVVVKEDSIRIRKQRKRSSRGRYTTVKNKKELAAYFDSLR